MNVDLGLRFPGDYAEHGAASVPVYHGGLDLVGSAFAGADLVGEAVCLDSMGHQLPGSLASLSALAVTVHGTGGDLQNLGEWAGQLLLTGPG